MGNDLDYFIDFFESIPSNLWGTKKFKQSGRRCAFGHLGCIESSGDTENARRLVWLLGGTLEAMTMFDVNDGKGEYAKFGDSPKERVINYLKSLEK